MEPTYNCISLFDGISATYLGLQRAGIKIDKYFSSEIEPNALKVQKHHHGNSPNFIQLGDVRNVQGSQFPTNYDIVFSFGFPCLDLSIIKKNREGLTGPQSSLFYEALRILKELKRHLEGTGKQIYFIAENVASMTSSDKQAILEHLQEVYPETYVINIDSKLVSASRRNRLYFTNIPGIEQPEDLGIKLSEIIENGFVDRDKSRAVLSSNVTLYKSGLKRHLTMGVGTVIYCSESFSKKSTEDKLAIYPKLLEASGYEGKPNKESLELDFPNGVYRLPSIKEYCRLMTFPDNYLDIPQVSTTAKVKLLGLSMTVGVMQHILNFIPSELQQNTNHKLNQS